MSLPLHPPPENAPLGCSPGQPDDCQPDEYQPVDWQTAMKRAVRSTAQLREMLDLAPAGEKTASSAGRGSEETIGAAEKDFPTFVPLELLRRIRPGDLNDPILLQVMATENELVETEGYLSDPVGDLQAEKAEGLLHKYTGRALIVTHGACAVHCRYCFRREFPYALHGSSRDRWRPAIEYLANDSSIHEVLLSGGDPLTLTDSMLDYLFSEIESIEHIQRLRIHTRLPVVIPQRVTEQLVDRLSGSRLAVWIVIHSNHAQEMDDSVTAATARFIDSGIPVLNQSVLLAGINDSVQALEDLSMTLVNHRVQPYYLHQLDKVRGAGHFWVSQSRGESLIAELRKRLPGYAVPKFVVEQSGRESKTPIA